MELNYGSPDKGGIFHKKATQGVVKYCQALETQGKLGNNGTFLFIIYLLMRLSW